MCSHFLLFVDYHEDGEVSHEFSLADAGSTLGSDGHELVEELGILLGRLLNGVALVSFLVGSHLVTEVLELGSVEHAITIGVSGTPGGVELSFLLILRSGLRLGFTFLGAVVVKLHELSLAVGGEESKIGLGGGFHFKL